MSAVPHWKLGDYWDAPFPGLVPGSGLRSGFRVGLGLRVKGQGSKYPVNNMDFRQIYTS